LETLIPARFRPRHASQVTAFGESAVRARRMGERGQIFGLRRSGEEFPAEAAISHLGSDGRQVYSVVLRDITERRRALEAQEFLALAGERLSTSLGEEETFRNITQLAVPRLADACVVNSHRKGVFHAVAVSHRDSARAQQI